MGSATTMHGSVEEQLLTSQEMFLEIERQVASLSALGMGGEQGAEGSSCQQEAADLLSCRLELLKTSLVSFQLLLLERQEEEQTQPHHHTAQQQPSPQKQRPPEAKLKRSASVQEMFSSPRNKLLRQSSVQQQKELEQELCEQRGLTQAIARQGSRASLLSQDSEEHAQQATRSAATEADGKGEEPIDRKWEHLLGRLVGLEQSSVHHASMIMVSDSSGSQAEGASGCVIIDSSILAGLQSHGSRLRELGHSAAQLCHQAVPDEGSLQRLEEGLFDVLSGVSLSLSVLANLLQTPPGTTREEDTQLRLLQLQSVSSELSSLGSELVSQGSKISGALGSGSGGRCVELLSRVLTAVQTGLTRRLTRLETLLEQTRQHQRKVTDLHAALTSNQLAVNQITNGANRSQDINLQLQAVAQLQQSLQQQACQVSSLLEEVHRQELPASLIHQATHLQGEVEGALAGACGTYEELKNSVELQRHHERLATSLDELLTAGAERLSRQPGAELHSRAGLQQQLSDHTKFFQFLGNHLRNLQYVTQRVPQSALQRWEGVVKELQDRVNKLLQKGLERGIAMQETLQTWTQWEEDSAWLDSLLRELETASPRVHLVEDSEEKTAENLTACQKMKGVLEESRARFRRTLEAGLRLQGAGCRGVGGVTRKLEAHWTALHRRAEQERTVTDRNRKLGSKFTCDSAALNEWMDRAREMIGSWSQLANQETELNHSRDHYQQFVEFTKDLEAKSGLKASVLSTGTQLLHLSETDRLSRRDTGDRQSPSSKNCTEFHADSCPVQSRLSQMAMDWANLLANVPLLQQALHKRYIETVSQEEAMAELQSWLGGVESRVEEQQQRLNQPSSNSSTDLCQILTCYKECHIELSAHQATLDYVNQPVLHICSAPDGQRGCCEHTRFSEELGAFNHRWLSLRATLNSQIQEVEQQMRGRADREGRLQQLIGWISAHRSWLTSALAPDSQSEVAERIATCEDHETMIRQKLTVLQELREKHSREGGGFICLVDGAIRSCTALLQQNSSVQQRLAHIQELWDRLDNGLKQAALTTLRTSHILGYHGNPQLCLQAHRDVLEVLQLLRTETEGTDTEWDGLTETLSSLGDMISPSVAALISEHRDRERARWSQVSADLERCLQRGQRLLQVWAAYARLAVSFSQQLHGLQLELQALLDDGAPGLDNTTERLTAKIQAAHSLQERTDMLQTELEGALQASKVLVDHLEPPAAALVQSESRLMSRGILQLGHSLSQKLAHMQEDLGQAQQFDSMLESLERHLGDWQDRLKHVSETAAHRDTTQSELVQFFGLCADLDVVNELSHSVTLGDKAAQRLQSLNRLWAHTSNTSMDTCSELQMEALRRQKFQEKCESWMSFLQRMEDSLAVELAGTYTGLREQLRTHQRFQAELSTGHQILHSVITEALHLLHRGEVEDRSDFILKLSQLREHWQGAVQRASQRRSLVEGLVKHWHQYSRSLRKLQRFLSHAQTLLPPAGPTRCSLMQHRRTLLELQHTELWFQRYQCSYLHTVELGRQLFSMGDQDTQEQLQQELGNLQEDWDNLQGLLAKRTELTHSIVKTWEQCEARLGDGVLRVKDVKTRLNQSMPDYVDELQRAEHFNKESNRDSLEEDWAESLTELSAMKTDLSQYIIADDVLLLQEQVEHLHCHWEELCLKVSLRKQEIADRLNAWIIFNDKNKELCEWLTQMENKVAHNNSDLSIEEMVEKLKKDCMEEMNLFSENKTHLKQLGEQLITASNKTKETEVNDKLKDINDRWQHLFDHIDARVRKLKETLVTVQQLDKNMSNLRTWLSRIEAELSKPVVYSVCHSDEIQRKLAEQQDLQRDIEQHTEGVASVLTLCDVLLHDADACGGGSDSENDSIQQTTRSLDRRWRNICAMSMERRMRIEETWRLWCKFLDDYSRFEDWLKTAEQTAANPVSAHVLYTSAKEELKKFEAFQRQVHERLTQLELVNKQYRRLARENRTDAASRLKVMVHEGNLRWDHLQRRVAAVLRRLKHFTSQREDFEGTREAILVWLTEMDLQLTNVEHFSESDIEDKMRQLNGFQQEITLNTNKIDALIVFGENLIQKSAPLDAVLIEDELEELHSYCQEVFGRVARFHQRLVNRRPVLEEERELSDRDTDLEDSPDLSSTPPSWRRAQKEEEEEVGGGGGASAGRQVAAVCHHLLAPPLERCSGRETPVSVDSIPLEWDHTVDVGGSSSHEDDEDATFFSALSDVEVTESTESFVKATAKALKGASVKSVTDPPNWHQSDTPERKRVPRGLDSSPTHTTSTPYHPQGYVKLMAECSGSVNSVKRVKLILNDEEDLDESGLTGSTANKHTSTAVIERWELIQAQGLGQDMDIKQDLEQWQKLNSSLCDITSWLGRVQPELERLQRLAPATSLRDMEGHIRRLKEMQKTFNSYKCVLISVNLSSRRFQRGDSVELQELQEGLRSVNHSWTQACSALESWERRLHQALMECQEFHEMLHSLLMWLARAENRCYAVNIHDPKTPHTALLEHRETLLVLDRELRAGQRQVSSMQELSSHLLLEACSSSSGESGEEEDEEDSVEAKEKLHVISNKLRLLLRQVAADLLLLQGRLESCPSSLEMDSMGLGTLMSPLLLQKEGSDPSTATVKPTTTRRDRKRDSSPPRPFFQRVLRAAFPLHILFLLLLVLACLVPMSEEDFSCTLTNNFARSFYPMLRYTNGPPPT